MKEEGTEDRAAAKAAGTIFCSQHGIAEPRLDLRMLILPSLAQRAQGILRSEKPQDNLGGFLQTPEKARIQRWSATKPTKFEKEKIKQTGGKNAITAEKKFLSPLALHNKKVCQAPV